MQGIQQNDFCPILDLHYRLLAKSEYGIKDRFIITFDEIDTPTAKEAAEIRQIEANTDATYINGGILAPDELRQKLREDEDSGYSALEDEEEEMDLFNEQEKDPNSKGGFFTKERLRDAGGSSNEQSPFSTDEWEENKHPRKENGQFGEGGESSSNEKFEDRKQHEEDLKHSFKAQEEKMILLAMDYAEFKDVNSQINSLRDTKYKNKRVIKHYTPGFIYIVKNNGINNYLFMDKMLYNEDIKKDWD